MNSTFEKQRWKREKLIENSKNQKNKNSRENNSHRSKEDTRCK